MSDTKVAHVTLLAEGIAAGRYAGLQFATDVTGSV